MAHFIMIHKAIDTNTDIYLNIIYCRSNHTIHSFYITYNIIYIYMCVCVRISHKSRDVSFHSNVKQRPALVSRAMTSSLWQRRGSGKLKPHPICTTARLPRVSRINKKTCGEVLLEKQKTHYYKAFEFHEFFGVFFFFFSDEAIEMSFDFLKW